MRILHIMPYVPVPPDFGGALRMYHILRHLVQHHDVTMLVSGSQDDRGKILHDFGPQLRALHIVPIQLDRKYWRLWQMGAMVKGRSFLGFLAFNKQVQRKIDELLDQNEFDVIQTEFTFMGGFQIKGKALKILDAHNIEHENYRRMWVNARSLLRKIHYYREYKKLSKEEIEACRRYDAVFTTSENDKKILDALVPSVVKFVVPNGVDTQYFKPSTESEEPYSLIFTGMMAYLPNHDGMLYFLDEILPHIQQQIPEVKIYIVGNKPPQELLKRASSNVIVTGHVDDVRPFIRRSSVYVVPLRMGSGTRLKVLEAMAMKKPIVTTSIGCEGIDVKDRESVLMEDSPMEFAGAVVELLKNQRLRRALSENGYNLVHARYDWSIIGQSIEQYYQTLLANKSSARAVEAELTNRSTYGCSERTSCVENEVVSSQSE